MPNLPNAKRPRDTAEPLESFLADYAAVHSNPIAVKLMLEAVSHWDVGLITSGELLRAIANAACPSED